MARLRKSRMLQSGIAYLEEKYPGIVNDTIEYKHERLTTGEERVTVTLLVKDDKATDALAE